MEQRECVTSMKQELQELRTVLEAELAKEELSALRVSLDSLRQQVAMTQSLRDHLGEESTCNTINLQRTRGVAIKSQDRCCNSIKTKLTFQRLSPSVYSGSVTPHRCILVFH